MMTRKQWFLTLVGVLLLGGGGYGACALEMADEEEANLVMDPAQVPGDVIPPTGHEPRIDLPDPGVAPGLTAPGPEIPDQATHPAFEVGGAAEAQACAQNLPCPAGQRCCHPAAACVPADCADCCDRLMDPMNPPPGREPGPDEG